ncbi:fatty acid desaturase [Calothrix sp. FACHB-1219]|uniref:beta-carotene ketolase CrtW n=1 Tax=unclassified Calothrix TaxID=2619626 RepID=UPI001682A860|nr:MULTISPECIES: fatty acid desaturase [unclassified Calothrix]MBD2203630.1 fatty acid desaturase [Calothrix sp. FACHB-168]MBD2219936.1 fatty acid desaturase [Calothrix sp. FACHB-1219]
MNIWEKPVSYNLEIENFATRQDSVYGLVIALLIISLWLGSLVWLLSINYHQMPLWLIPIALIWQTFLSTGLFITAHDAMHGSVCRQNPRINHLIGKIAVTLYALFPYQQLLQKHWLHHKHPASALDPDFHDQNRKSGFFWYLHFMMGYSSWQQLLGFTIIFNFARFAFNMSLTNLIIFWCIPPILSSIQLFYFGTYLPHREPKSGYIYPHCTQTIELPTFWSFLACYHFGYHQEHHEYPHVAWWQLPEVYQRKKADGRRQMAEGG